MKNRRKQIKDPREKKIRLKIVEHAFEDSLKRMGYMQEIIQSLVDRYQEPIKELQNMMNRVNEPLRKMQDQLKEATKPAISIPIPPPRTHSVHMENAEEIVEVMLLKIKRELSPPKKALKKRRDDQVIFLNVDGELYIQQKNNRVYALKKDHKPHRLLAGLSSTYTGTEQLRIMTGNSSVEATRKMTKKINYNIKTKLGISNFIQGRSGNGYRVNPKYKLKRVQ